MRASSRRWALRGAWATGAGLLLLGCGDDGGDGSGGGSSSATVSATSSASTTGATTSSAGSGGSGGAASSSGTNGTGGGGTGGTGGAGAGGAGGGPDVVPPTTTFASAPDDPQSNGIPSAFTLSCSEASCTFECSLDGAPFASCDATFAFDSLDLGDHSLAVRATDAVGNVEDPPAVHDWSLVFGWRDVATAYAAACGISGERRLYCWGSDDDGGLGDGPGGPEYVIRPTLVDDASDWEAFSSGASTFCARKTTGELHCWGDGYPIGFADAVDAPTLVSDELVTLEANYDAACGLDASGALQCVGWGGDGMLADGILGDHYATEPTPVGTDSYVDLSVGDGFACAVREDGRLLCWGWLPVAAEAVALPEPVDDATDWSRVAAGDAHACALKTTGAVYCWGENYSGQLGTPGGGPTATPTQVGADDDWVDVFAGGGTSCAVKADGSTSCWGSSYSAELGSPLVPIDRVDAPTPLTPTFRSLSRSSDFACGVTTDGFVLCWGDNDSGRLGRDVDPYQPTMVHVDDGFTSIGLTDGGGGCGIRSGQAVCWGAQRANGLPPGFFAPIPTPVSSDTDWTQVSVSTVYAGHACGIRAGALYCWGANDYGQLGDGSTTPSDGPVAVAPVPGVTGWSDVSAGAYATCAVSTGGDLFCWGFNQYGQLGIGSNEPFEVLPVAVAGSGWDDVEMGFYRVAAHRSDRTFWHWGVNDGDAPSQVPGSDWVRVGVTGFAECGIQGDGSLHCTQQGIPGAYQAGTATDWASIVGPGYPYCALNAAGAVGCFVPATQTSFNASPAIEAGDGWLGLQAQSALVCGLRAGDERHCRGPRRYGSLGDGFDERVPTPVVDP